MPRVTRSQVKQLVKPKPYCKENRPSKRRTALLDVVENNRNGTKTSTNIKKSDERVFKTGNENEKTSLVTQPKKNENLSTSVTQIKNEKPNTLVNKQIKNKNPVTIVTKKIELRSCTKEVPRLSLNSTKDSSLYQSAVESELYVSAVDNEVSCSHVSEAFESAVQELSVNNIEDEIFEIDQNSWSNFLYVGCYARDIFKYLKRREEKFLVTDYISNQSEITPRHRAVVVDWLISLQETFGLNHEVLYMAVKLIDLYLMKYDTYRNKFQLLASAALLLSSKIDERELGFPFELVKQSKFIFTEEELFMSERELAKTLNYDINIPLSYCFLRRFARCMKVQMMLLTLARYILECSLMDYSFVTVRDSLKAAAALYLSFKMHAKSIDPKEFNKYTGYNVNEIKNTVIALNNMLHTLNPTLSAAKRKYSDETFYRVACRSLLSNSKLTFN